MLFFDQLKREHPALRLVAAGVWLKWRVLPFRYRSMWWEYREYTLRVLWFEISLSELPF